MSLRALGPQRLPPSSSGIGGDDASSDATPAHPLRTAMRVLDPAHAFRTPSDVPTRSVPTDALRHESAVHLRSLCVPRKQPSEAKGSGDSLPYQRGTCPKKYERPYFGAGTAEPQTREGPDPQWPRATSAAERTEVVRSTRAVTLAGDGRVGHGRTASGQDTCSQTRRSPDAAART